ncbi:Got1-domain-containing protein, partial [Lactarius sanguifluus]
MQKIGVGLTSFGALFMLLGVMLFFDGALLALGNVLFLGGLFLIIGPQKTFYFFRAEEQAAGDRLLPRRHPPRLPQVADRRCVGRDVWLSQSVRVRCYCCYPVARARCLKLCFFSRDFFPVILTFLRQVPFIGQFLNLSYVRPFVDRFAGSRTSV